MSKPRVGIIGCGNRCISVVNLVKDAIDIVAIADPQEKCRQRFLENFPGTYTEFEDYQPLLNTAECDWVFIVTPNHMHKEQAIASMRAGKHVFCEKPLATSIDDCFEIAAVQQETGSIFFADLPLRFAPLHATMKQYIDDGKIGEIISIDFNECITLDHGGHIVTNSWRRFAECSGGHIVEKCCHDLDIANWFTGSLPQRVASFGGLNCYVEKNKSLSAEVGPREDGTPAYKAMRGINGTDLSPFESDKTVIDNQVAIIEYQNGIRATFHTNLHSADPERRFYIIGTKGTLRGEMYSNTLSYRPIGHNSAREDIPIVAKGGHGGADVVLADGLIKTMCEGQAPLSDLHACLCGTVTALSIQQAMEDASIIDMQDVWQRLHNQAPQHTSV